jgi:hypothetical protein
MDDELQRLREEQGLFCLLTHYVQGNAVNPDAWQDRLMALDGVSSDALTRLHGELLAYDWIEQNTGVTEFPSGPPAPRCYRATTGGSRAHKQARVPDDDNSRAA